MKFKEGYHLETTPLTFGRSRLIVTDGFFVEEFW
jgi:hypothetical protein